MSRSNVRGLVAFSKVFRSDRLTNLIPGYTIPVCLQFPPSSTHRSADVSLFPLVCPLLPSFSSFFPPPLPFFARVCVRARNGRISSTKNRGRKTREGMTRGKRETRDPLLPTPSPPRALFDSRCSPLRRETRSRFRDRGGRVEDVAAEDVDRCVNSLWCGTFDFILESLSLLKIVILFRWNLFY